jgi:hypothetical protein
MRSFIATALVEVGRGIGPPLELPRQQPEVARYGPLEAPRLVNHLFGVGSAVREQEQRARRSRLPERGDPEPVQAHTGLPSVCS